MSAPSTAVDWKKLAFTLARRLDWAARNLKAPGMGMVMSKSSDELTPWRHYLIEPISQIPGITVDWDVLDSLDLPRAKRDRFISDRRKARAREQVQCGGAN